MPRDSCALSGNTLSGLSAVCGPDDLVSVDLRRCESSENGDAGGIAVGVRLPDGNSFLRGNTFVNNDTASSLVPNGSPLYEGTGVGGNNAIYNN